jgi:hypothetical protein
MGITIPLTPDLGLNLGAPTRELRVTIERVKRENVDENFQIAGAFAMSLRASIFGLINEGISWVACQISPVSRSSISDALGAGFISRFVAFAQI